MGKIKIVPNQPVTYAWLVVSTSMKVNGKDYPIDYGK